MIKKSSFFRQKGFTLIELLVSITLVSIILSFFFPFFSQSMENSLNNQKKMVSLNMAKELLYDFQNNSSADIFKDKGKSCMFENNVEIPQNINVDEFPIKPIVDKSLSDYYYEVDKTKYYPKVTICQDSDTEKRLNLYKIHIQIYVYKANSKTLISELYGYIHNIKDS